ncbi:MAG: hypothetical protein ACRD2S_11425 [Terriglobales bacterium]
MQRTLLRFARIGTLVSMIVALPLICLAGKDFQMPKSHPASAYPAHDYHSNELVSVGLDPYNTPAKASIFSVHYSDLGILPVFVVITNDGDQPVALTGMHVELVTSDRTKLTPSSPDDIYRRISKPHPHTSSYPLPFPTKKTSGGVSKKAMTEIQNAQFDAHAVEPHSSQSGFFFFDVSDISDPSSGAHLYLTGVHDAKGDELMYFDVAFGKD